MLAIVSIVVTLAAASPEEADVEALVLGSVDAWAAGHAARVELKGLQSSVRRGCVPAHVELPRGGLASGTAVLKLLEREDGASCGWTRASLKVWQQVLVTRRIVKEGEALAAVVQQEERERISNDLPLQQLPERAVAAHALPAGAALDEGDAQLPRPGLGQKINVALIAGSLTLSTTAVVVPCRRSDEMPGQAVVCTRLPSGKLARGVLQGERVLVEAL